MEFSTFDAPHDNVGGRCLAKYKDANWHNGVNGHCSAQSVNGLYKGKYVTPNEDNGVLYWDYSTPLKTIQLMVRPVAWY